MVGFRIVIAALLAMSASAEASARQIVTVDPVVIADATASVTVSVSFPESGRTLPVVILSHGNRLSRHDYRPLTAALTQAGFVVIQPDHPDASVDGFPPAREPTDGWRTRALQLRSVANHLHTIEMTVPSLRGRIDRARIAVVGHSFGAHSAAMLMGLSVIDPVGGRPVSIAEPRIRAAVLLSAPGSYDGLTNAWKVRAPYLKVDWTTMRGPMLIVNGERDVGPMSDAGPRWHDDAYRRTPVGRGLCLMLIPGVGHYLGGIDGPLRSPAGDATPERIGRVTAAMVGFLLASLYTNDRTTAMNWAEIRQGLVCT